MEKKKKGEERTRDSFLEIVFQFSYCILANISLLRNICMFVHDR